MYTSCCLMYATISLLSIPSLFSPSICFAFVFPFCSEAVGLSKQLSAEVTASGDSGSPEVLKLRLQTRSAVEKLLLSDISYVAYVKSFSLNPLPSLSSPPPPPPSFPPPPPPPSLYCLICVFRGTRYRMLTCRLHPRLLLYLVLLSAPPNGCFHFNNQLS